jgi:hypothetical protein
METSLSSLRNDSASLVAAPHAWYSASMVEAAVVGCLQLSQEIATPKQTTTHPETLRRVSAHAAKFASQKISIGTADRPYVMPRSAVLATYWMTSSKAA